MHPRPKARTALLTVASLAMIVMATVGALLTHRKPNLYVALGFLTVLAIVRLWAWRRPKAKGP